MSIDKKSFSLDDNQILKEIVNNYENKKYNIVNIIMEPYRSEIIIKKFINVFKVRILCLTYNINLLNNSYDDVFFYSLDNWKDIREQYDIILIDDLSGYSKYKKIDLLEMGNYLYQKTKMIVLFSIEEIFENCLSLYITAQNKYSHFIEPRIIISKLNLKKKIPNIVIEYFEYFNKIGDNTIVYVGKNKREIFYENLNKYISTLDNIEIIISDNNIIKLISTNKSQVIITENIDDIIDCFDNTNFIIYSPSKEFFTYKKIVFICGRLSLLKDEKEMIIVSKEDSNSIDIAKGITRTYNKIVWE